MNIIFAVIAAISVLAAVILLATWSHARRRTADLQQRASELEERVSSLQPYTVIADVAAYVSSQKAEAQRLLESAHREIANAREHAATEAAQINRDAAIEAASVRAAAGAEATRIRAETVDEVSRLRAAANAEVSRVQAEAAAEASRLRSQAVEAFQVASAERETMLSAARRSADEMKAAATQLVEGATERHRELIAAAEARAKEIAGEALAAVRDAKRAEETVRALKNVIEGYGDAYLVPPQDLLDELGAAYSFEQAGAQLKETRAKVRSMVKEGRAATCEYVEDVRRATAINFVTDAFNGKVSTILADVKEDNYGTLEQKIKDAAALVNENGKAFRDARVAPAYLQLRLEELKWAVATYQLRERDREEQRLLKERIREEERAQREFEKALKDAEKEEELLRKAMEKAQAQFDKASDAQKAKYEEQLKELAVRLQMAEDKGKRAMSMAQQTKSGHVYVISNIGSFGEDIYKIGLTRRLEPLDRIRELGDASVPFDFDVHALIPSSDAPALERTLHKQFIKSQVNKVNPRKEFFRVRLEDVRSIIERNGCNATWTMTAEARQYRETLAVERALKDGRVSEQQWIAQQVKEHEQLIGAEARVDSSE